MSSGLKGISYNEQWSGDQSLDMIAHSYGFDSSVWTDTAEEALKSAMNAIGHASGKIMQAIEEGKEISLGEGSSAGDNYNTASRRAITGVEREVGDLKLKQNETARSFVNAKFAKS